VDQAGPDSARVALGRDLQPAVIDRAAERPASDAAGEAGQCAGVGSDSDQADRGRRGLGQLTGQVGHVQPDAGRLVDQQAVPILPNDTAREVFDKVTLAAEIVLDRSLPGLVSGSVKLAPQNLAAGSYFGARRPEDGRIDWTRGALEIHNLVRAVAPPYPGAFSFVGGAELRVLRTLDMGERDPVEGQPALHVRDGHLYLRGVDGGLLRVLSAEYGGAPLTSANFATRLGGESVPLHP